MVEIKGQIQIYVREIRMLPGVPVSVVLNLDALLTYVSITDHYFIYGTS